MEWGVRGIKYPQKELGGWVPLKYFDQSFPREQFFFLQSNDMQSQINMYRIKMTCRSFFIYKIFYFYFFCFCYRKNVFLFRFYNKNNLSILNNK